MILERGRPSNLFNLSVIILFLSTSWIFLRSKMGDFAITELERKCVRIKNPAKVKSMIKEFMDGGRGKLQVIADFDRTLSRYKFEGKIMPTCHNVLNSSGLMSEKFKKQAKAMYEKYYPIEMDKNLTPEQKLPFMVEWWTAAHKQIVESNITKEKLEAMIAKSNVKLREGTAEFFQDLRDSDVPLLIFSAGLGDIIEGVLRQSSLLFDNMKTVSNFLAYNEEGLCIGFTGDIIHIYNKNEGAIHDSDYFKILEKRNNVMLLGDSVGDLTMAKGVENGNILKIGFLNDRIEELMDTYMDLYDIVLVEDESLDIANAILRQIS